MALGDSVRIRPYDYSPTIDHGYHDGLGEWHVANPDVVTSLTEILTTLVPPADLLRVNANEPTDLEPNTLLLIGGTEPFEAGQASATGIPVGRHLVRHQDGRTHLLLSAPQRCTSAAALRTGFGLGVQAHSLTNDPHNSPHGSFAALRETAQWATRHGASAMVLSPMGAPQLTPRVETSPYYPSSRRFGNPLFLIDDIHTIPHRAGRVDRDATWLHVRQQLAALALAPLDPAAERFFAEQGDALTSFGTYMALSEVFGSFWRHWPTSVQDPHGVGVSLWAAQHPLEVRLHMLGQWRFFQELERLSTTIPLIHDVPVGVAPGGVDSWMEGLEFLQGWNVGAPPDAFSPTGQAWGFEPLNPTRLAQSGGGALRSPIAALLDYGAGVRIDHVLGLFRLFVIPPGATPREGVYLRYPTDVLLDMLAIESVHSGGVIIGEDLGTVEPGTREGLRERGILGYYLMWFDGRPPGDLDPNVLAAITTHDLPTVAGVLTGSDEAELTALGVPPRPGEHEGLRERIGTITSATTVEDTIVDLYCDLTRSPSPIVVTLEDALAMHTRPNVPGTMSTQRPNWSIPYAIAALDLDLSAPAVRLLDSVAAARVTHHGDTDDR